MARAAAKAVERNSFIFFSFEASVSSPSNGVSFVRRTQGSGTRSGPEALADGVTACFPRIATDPNQCPGLAFRRHVGGMEWHPIATAPFDRDLELAVIGYEGPHGLVFACRRVLGGWINAETKKLVDVGPTHWREWRDRP